MAAVHASAGGRQLMATDHAARTRRRYRSPRREMQAAQTREAVLAAAGRLFTERGWAATGMRDVARAAGVSVETVYANFRSKADLLMAALDVAIAGDAEPVPLAQRPEFTALGCGSWGQRVRAAAGLATSIHRRTAGVHLALREAAASDTELARLLREAEQNRRITVEQGAALVVGRALTLEEYDGLWAVASAEVYQLLTELRGWTSQQYETWLAVVIDRLLRTPGSANVT
jgi:AcrR family transcriptional regulator